MVLAVMSPLASASEPSAGSEDFAWQKKGPLEFLEMLRSHSLAPWEGPGFVVEGRHFGWVTIEDVPKLMGLLDSEEPCSGVVSVLSSWLPTEASTVGQEALFLIEGFRSGFYPPRLASQRYSRSKEEVREWWRSYLSAHSS
ncbi:MAG: hypothetical protein SF066_09530 [Thermoanaerobaculia bacterium]|nr:hypothetical protein [Thermoanaerobaculia bacterium]